RRRLQRSGSLGARRPAGRRRLRPISRLPLLGAAAGVLVAIAVYVLVALPHAGPAATIRPVSLTRSSPAGARALAWPKQGQAAVALAGVGLIGDHGAQRPTPIASVAKIMTAALILEDHP